MLRDMVRVILIAERLDRSLYVYQMWRPMRGTSARWF